MLKKISGLVISMLTVFKHLFKKPITLEYPEEKIAVNDNFRGKPCVKNCIKCMTCIKVCPANAIIIEEYQFKINLSKCIFCGNCAYYCPTNAIKMGSDYELASSDKNDLILVYDIDKEENNNV